jgi:hypothetical protein
LPRPTTIELALNILLFKRNPWRAAIDDTADRGSVAFPEARKPEKVAESIERHNGSARVRLGNAHSAAGQLTDARQWSRTIGVLLCSPELQVVWLAVNGQINRKRNGH